MIDTDGKAAGSMSWTTTHVPNADKSANITTVKYECNPLMSGGTPYLPGDYNGKEMTCQAGTLDATNNRVDWCAIKVKFLYADGKKFEKLEAMDGYSKDFSGRNGADQYKGDNDGNDKQSCVWNSEETKYNLNGTTAMSPTIAWSKVMNSGDADQDNVLAFKDNLTVYWRIKDKTTERMGTFDGLYLDDPMNPVIAGAKTIVAGALTASALVYATLA